MTETAPTASSSSSPTIEFDPEDLTLDEVAELEELLGGGGFDEMLSGGAPKGKALRAIMWIMLRRSNPEATLEDAGKLRLRDIGIELVDSQAAAQAAAASSGND